MRETDLDHLLTMHLGKPAPRSLLDALIRQFAEEDIRSHEAGFMSGVDVGYRNGVEDRGRWADA